MNPEICKLALPNAANQVEQTIIMLGQNDLLGNLLQADNSANPDQIRNLRELTDQLEHRVKVLEACANGGTQ